MTGLLEEFGSNGVCLVYQGQHEWKHKTNIEINKRLQNTGDYLLLPFYVADIGALDLEYIYAMMMMMMMQRRRRRSAVQWAEDALTFYKS